MTVQKREMLQQRLNIFNMLAQKELPSASEKCLELEKKIITISWQLVIEIVLYITKITNIIKWQHFWQYILINYNLLVLADSCVHYDQVVR